MLCEMQSLCWNKHAAVITHSHFSRNMCQINVAWGELAWRKKHKVVSACRGFTVPLSSSRVCQIAWQKLNQLMKKYTNKNQWPLQPLVFILGRVCVLLLWCFRQAADRKQAAVSWTYHSPHAVCGGRANRVVVGVCCCIDSAIAARREAQRTRSLIYHWRGEQNIYACLFNAQPLKSTLSSLEHNQLFPSSASWASHIIQGGSKRGVQRLVNYTCLFIVILIRWIEWVMSTKRQRAMQRKHSWRWRAWSLTLFLFTQAAHWAHAPVFSLLLVRN